MIRSTVTTSYASNWRTTKGLVSSNFVQCESAVAYPGILFGGLQQIEMRTEDGENGDLGGGSPIVRGSGGSCNLVQEISFHIVKFFLIFGTLRLFMMTTNLFVIANVKQLRTYVDLEFYCLFSEHLGVLAS